MVKKHAAKWLVPFLKYGVGFALLAYVISKYWDEKPNPAGGPPTPGIGQLLQGPIAFEWLAAAALAVDVLLLGIQVFALKNLCVLCFTTYLISLVVALAAAVAGVMVAARTTLQGPEPVERPAPRPRTVGSISRVGASRAAPVTLTMPTRVPTPLSLRPRAGAAEGEAPEISLGVRVRR
mgnify:CR=1 FL=1